MRTRQMAIIRPATSDDAVAIAAIYNYYIANTVVTFEEEGVTVADMATRIGAIEAEGLPWLVATQDDGVVGYAYASKWKGRCAYRFSVESTIYVDPAATGRGIGTALYKQLVEVLRRLDLHAVIGGVALPNAGSVALHEKLGFRKVAQFHEVGFKFQRWIDVGYWQLTLETGAALEGLRGPPA